MDYDSAVAFAGLREGTAEEGLKRTYGSERQD